jgi:hypothetical protein
MGGERWTRYHEIRVPVWRNSLVAKKPEKICVIKRDTYGTVSVPVVKRLLTESKLKFEEKIKRKGGDKKSGHQSACLGNSLVPETRKNMHENKKRYSTGSKEKTIEIYRKCVTEVTGE